MDQVDTALNQSHIERQAVIAATTRAVGQLDPANIVENDSSGIVKGIPIEHLDAIRQDLKAILGPLYKNIRVRYRGPRPAELKIALTEDNILGTIALGPDAYRTPEQRKSGCLKRRATHISIYGSINYARIEQIHLHLKSLGI